MSSPLSTNLEAILDRFDEVWNEPPPPPIKDQVMKGGWRKGDSVLCRSHESQKYAVPNGM